MFADIRKIVARAHWEVLEDALGVALLFLLLFAGLSLSGAA